MTARPEELDHAEIEAIIEEHQEWVAAGRPGVKSHEEVVAELFGESVAAELLADSR